MKIIIIGAREGLIEAFTNKQVEVRVIDTAETITLPMPYAGYIWDGEDKINLSEYSCIVLVSRKKSSKLLYDALKNHILIVGNPYSRFAFDNKAFSSAIISEAGIPVIPLVFGHVTSKEHTRHLGDILVEKPDNLSRGEHVELKNSPIIHYKSNMIYQKYIDCGRSDERWICVEGKGVVCAMRRTSADPNEFRANLNKGGIGEKIVVTQEMQDRANKILSLFPGYLYTGIDILTDIKTGDSYFLESNVVPGTRIIEISGHNFYDDVFDHVMSKIKEKEQNENSSAS